MEEKKRMKVKCEDTTPMFLKAMILAAGYGTRLRPVTNNVPKPLIKINGKPVIEHTLNVLKKAGVKTVVINLYYLGDKIARRLGDGAGLGLNILYSYEPEIKGTAGALLWAKSMLNEPFYLINGDILFDMDLSALPSLLRGRNADAVMVLYKPKSEEHKIANIYLDKNGYVKSLFKPCRGASPYIFTGIQLLKPDAIDCIPKGISQPSTTLHMYPEMLKRGRLIAGYVHRGLWMDIGSIKKLELAKEMFR